jgi:hypothetical protein
MMKGVYMTKKYALIILCVIVLGAVIFGIYKELDKGKKSLVSEVAEKQKIADAIPVWLKGNKDVQKIQDDLNTLADYRAEYGCMTAAPNEVVECEHYNQRFDQQFANLQDTVHRLQIENKSQIAIAAATANIKDLAEDQSLQVTFTDIRDNLYTGDGKNVDIYRDSKGMEYSVNPATNKVVSFSFSPTPPQGSPYRMTPHLSRDQIWQKAEAYLSKHVSDFGKIKNSSDFIYTESSKDGLVHAFRWEANTKPAGEDIPPFIQLVVLAGTRNLRHLV